MHDYHTSIVERKRLTVGGLAWALHMCFHIELLLKGVIRRHVP